jgi:hypothetical protein
MYRVITNYFHIFKYLFKKTWATHPNEIRTTCKISYKVSNALHCLYKQPTLGALQSQYRKWPPKYRKLTACCGFMKQNQWRQCRDGFEESLGWTHSQDCQFILGAIYLHRVVVSVERRIQGAHLILKRLWTERESWQDVLARNTPLLSR